MGILLKNLPRQQTILGVLLVVWGITWFQTMGSTSEFSRVPLVNVSGPARMQALQQGELLTGLQKKVRQQSRKREKPFPAPINIFDLNRSEEQPFVHSEQLQAGEEEQVSFEADAFGEVQGSDATRFRFLGYVQLDHSTQEAQGIALVSTPDALHTVRSGETIEGRILIKEVSPEEIIIEDLSSHQKRHLQLRARGD